MDKMLLSAATSATLHCLLGCSIGEILGMVLGTAFSWNNFVTVVVSIILAFITGYLLSSYALVKHGLSFRQAMSIVLVADTLSILTMEIVDNTVIVLVPGAMNAGLNNALFWITLPISLAVAFVVTVPVNYILLKKGKGHALIHKYHGHSH